MTDLFARVLHHIEGNETETQNWQTADGIKTVEFHSFGPDRWIESVHENGRLMAIDCLALILFAVDKSLDKDQERRIVEGWAVELRKAVSAGEIQARDPFTLLALETPPDGWEWLISMADADKFIAARGMEWRFGEVTLHLFNEFEQAIQNRRFPPWTQTAPAQSPAAASSSSFSAALGDKPPTNWRHTVQAEAYEHWLRLRASGCNPSPHSICDDMARWCQTHNIRGDKGQNPSAGTIRNTVLCAGHWTPPYHSIAEAKKYVAQIAQTAQTKVAQTAQ